MLGAFILVAVGSSGILKGKQKVGVTFISDKLSGIDFTKFSKLTMKYIQKMACAVSIFQKVLVSNMYLCSSYLLTHFASYLIGYVGQCKLKSGLLIFQLIHFIA